MLHSHMATSSVRLLALQAAAFVYSMTFYQKYRLTTVLVVILCYMLFAGRDGWCYGGCTLEWYRTRREGNFVLNYWYNRACYVSIEIIFLCMIELLSDASTTLGQFLIGCQTLSQVLQCQTLNFLQRKCAHER